MIRRFKYYLIFSRLDYCRKLTDWPPLVRLHCSKRSDTKVYSIASRSERLNTIGSRLTDKISLTEHQVATIMLSDIGIKRREDPLQYVIASVSLFMIEVKLDIEDILNCRGGTILINIAKS